MSNEHSSDKASPEASPSMGACCPSCGVVVADALLFCESCGTSLKKGCPACGKIIRSNSAYCPFCGCNCAMKTAELASEEESRLRAAEERVLCEQAKCQERLKRLEEQHRNRQARQKSTRIWFRRHYWKLAGVVLVALGLGWFSKGDLYSYLRASCMLHTGMHREAAIAFQALAEYRDSKERASESIGLLFDDTFVRIPPGSFLMGSPSTELDFDEDEGPVHIVTVQGFEIMRTEVTQEQWELVMGVNPSASTWDSSLPVECVSWDDCQAFAESLSAIDPMHKYRMPTEAEWEYACRAGVETAYYWGQNMDGNYCWFLDNHEGATHPVGQKRPNAWGLFDMSGNVWEWCEDSYQIGYTGVPNDGSAWRSLGTSENVYRGGSCVSSARSCRSAARGHRLLESPFIGLRLARSEY
jgi:formylglycine-generating enzyme required for sulfatase activity